jgi:hypothetical protein
MNTISQNDMAKFGFSKFAKKEVLIDNFLKDERKVNLLRAILLHFIEHQTVKIGVCNDLNELFTVECDVIAVTDEHVVLKSGLVIPIAAIFSIELI